jgi:uncharacterized membrane protein YbhN (UPF0104 family)
MSERTSYKRIFLVFCSFVVSFSLLSYLLSRIDVDGILSILSKIDIIWLVGAGIVTCLLPLSCAIRWQGVLMAQSNIHFSFYKSIKVIMMSNVLNAFLPSKGGDMVKAVYLKKHTGLTAGLGNVALERMCDLLVLGVMGCTGLFFYHDVSSLLKTGIMAYLLFVIGVFGLLFQPFKMVYLPKIIQEIHDDFSSVFWQWIKSPFAVFTTLGGSLLTWLLSGSVLFLLSNGVGGVVGYGYIYLIYPVAVIAGLMPVTISGIGARDSAFVFLLEGRLSVEEATLIGIGYTVFVYWFLALISFPMVSHELFRLFRQKK